MAKFYYEKLSRQTKKKMRNKDYLFEELVQIQQEIKQLRLIRMKGFKRVILMMSIAIVLNAVLTFMVETNMDMMVIIRIQAFTAAIGVCVVLFIKFLGVDLVRNQFIWQIRRNYPEYIDYFRADSFK